MNERRPDTNIDVQIRLGEKDNAQGLLTTDQKASLLSMKDVANVLSNKGINPTVEEIVDASKVAPVKIGSKRGNEILLSM